MLGTFLSGRAEGGEWPGGCHMGAARSRETCFVERRR